MRRSRPCESTAHAAAKTAQSLCALTERVRELRRGGQARGAYFCPLVTGVKRETVLFQLSAVPSALIAVHVPDE